MFLIKIFIFSLTFCVFYFQKQGFVDVIHVICG